VAAAAAALQPEEVNVPVKRRQPKERTPVISQRALELFAQMRRCSRGSERWYELHGELHQELDLKPWQWPIDKCEIWQELAAAARAARRAVAAEQAQSDPLVVH
jgi:hypothetical protein